MTKFFNSLEKIASMTKVKVIRNINLHAGNGTCLLYYTLLLLLGCCITSPISGMSGLADTLQIDCPFTGNLNYESRDDFATCDYRFTMNSNPPTYPAVRPFDFSNEIGFDVYGGGTSIRSAVFLSGKGISISHWKSRSDALIESSIRNHFGRYFEDSTLTDALVMVDIEHPVHPRYVYRFDDSSYQHVIINDHGETYGDYTREEIIYEFKRRYRITREVLPKARIVFYSYINRRNGNFSQNLHNSFLALGEDGVFDYVDFIGVNLYLYANTHFYNSDLNNPWWNRIRNYTTMALESTEMLIDLFGSDSLPLSISIVKSPYVLQTPGRTYVPVEVRKFQDSIVQTYSSVEIIQYWMGQSADYHQIYSWFTEYALVPQVCFCSFTSYNQVINNNPVISVFPNPATTEIFIDVPEEEHRLYGSSFIQLLDLSGRVVLEQTVSPHQSICIESLPSGLYLATIKCGNFNRVQKVVKK